MCRTTSRWPESWGTRWPTTHENLAGKTVGDVCLRPVRKIPSVDARDGVIKVAAEMAQQRCPLIAVTENGMLHGVITASRLLAAALKS